MDGDDGGPTRSEPRAAGCASSFASKFRAAGAEATMDELIRSHAPKRERDFDAAPPAKQRATTNDLSLDRTLDELFAEGGALAGQLRPRKEEDARRLAQRAKQVEFGKNTNGYENYVRAVPKRERKGYQEHPRTPDITQEASKRKFDGIVQAWRRKLHEWDEPAPTAPLPPPPPTAPTPPPPPPTPTTPLTTTSSRHSDNSGRPGPCPRPRVPPRPRRGARRAPSPPPPPRRRRRRRRRPLRRGNRPCASASTQ